MDGSQLYPATGMLVMAIEAAKHLHGDDNLVQGFRLRDVVVHRALVVPDDDEGVETQLSLQSQHSVAPGAKSQRTWSFRIYILEHDHFRTVCSGLIAVETRQESDISLLNVGAEQIIRSNAETYHATAQNCTKTLTDAEFYKSVHTLGAQYGASFRNLRSIACGESAATARVKMNAWRTMDSACSKANVVAHPTTLDSMFQLPYAGLLMSERENTNLKIPTHLQEVWISHSLLRLPDDIDLVLHAVVQARGMRHVDIRATASMSHTMEPLIVFDRCRLTAANSTKSSHQDEDQPRRLCYQLEVKPDFDMLRLDQLSSLCSAATAHIETPVQTIDEALPYYFLRRALDDLARDGFVPAASHLRKYVRWATQFVNYTSAHDPASDREWRSYFQYDGEELDVMLDSYAATLPARDAHVQFGRELPRILRGETDVLHFLFNQGVVYKVYGGPAVLFSVHRLAEYISLLGHKDAGIDILEIGAGTGSGTKVILDALLKQGKAEGETPRYNSYDFTDISPSFFDEAQKQFKKHTGRIRFKTLDVDKDPLQQGFTTGQYDVIIAVSVLHATTCIDTTLGHLRSLLKPGGHLLLTEPTNLNSAVIPFLAGVLPGWWLGSEPERHNTPLFAWKQWDKVLSGNGFSGMDLFLPDNADERKHVFSFIASRATSDEDELDLDIPVIIVATESCYQQQVAQKLKSALRSLEFMDVRIESLISTMHCSSSNVACVSLLELESSFLGSMTEESFACLKNITQKARHLIWVTLGGGENPVRPETDLISGYGKTLSIEQPSLKFTQIDVQSGTSVPSSVVRALKAAMPAQPRDVETYMVEREGVLFVPRTIQSAELDVKYNQTFGNLFPEPRLTPADPSERLCLDFTPGQLDTFKYVMDTRYVSDTLECGQVEVQVKATGINFKDVMVALGQLSDTHIGQEFSGIVKRTGTSSYLTPGTRVYGVVPGSFRTNVFVHERAVNIVPEHMSLNEAAAVPVAFTTAHYGLHHLGRLEKEQTVLIHAAAGAVGQAAIQLALQVGARIFVTVSSLAKQKLLMEKYGLCKEQIFSSRSLQFARHLSRATEGRGIDVALNSLAGEALLETWRSMAPLGRFIEIGKRDIDSFASLPMAPFARNVTFASLDLGTVYQHNPTLFGQLMKEVQDMFSTRTLSPPQPIQIFKRSGFEEAFRYLQTGTHSGKAVVNWSDQDILQVVPSRPKSFQFKENASYVIAGGMGGIGRSIARWMVRHGAKHLIMLSRSGDSKSAAKELLEELRNTGINAESPACDIAKNTELENALSFCRASMPPIKGCIQAAMVVENKTFQNMTLAEFNAPLRSKVQGTWNLHDLLPKDLDFFILLASLGGVHGANSQCNYAAACSFQDAFARYRHSRGENCTSLDLGIVSSVGYIAERFDVAQNVTLSYTGHDHVNEQELLFLMEQACTRRIPSTASSWETQILAGVTTPTQVRRIGFLEEHAWMQKPQFRHLYQIGKMAVSDLRKDDASRNLGALLKKSTSWKDASAIITGALQQRLSRSLSVPEEDIDLHRPAHAFGVDSLVAVELQFWFSNEIKADLTVLQILGGNTIAELGISAARKSACTSHIVAETCD